MGDSVRRGSRSEDINHSFLFNFGESVDGVGRNESRYWTIPYPYHNSGDHGILSGFNIYGDNISGDRYHISQFSAYPFTHWEHYSMFKDV